MLKKILLSLSLLLALIASNAMAVAELKIMVVFSRNVADTNNEDELYTSIEQGVRNVFNDAGLTRPTFYRFPETPSLLDPGLSESAALLLTNRPDISNARNQVSADVVLFVLTRTEGDNCGAAYEPSTYTSNFPVDVLSGKHLINGQSKFAAFITMFELNCNQPSFVYAAHEIGHVLWAEHQVIMDSQGNATGEVQSNGNVDKPVKHNHPAVSGNRKTIMFSMGPAMTSDRFFSKVGRKFSNGTNAYGEYANVATFFDDVMYEYVANYRNPTPPVVSSCFPQFLGCPPGCGHSPYLLTWNAQNASSYQVQRKNYLGSWRSYYSGSSTSRLASTGTLASEYFRVRALNNSGASAWCNITLYVQCSDNHDPW